MSPDWPAAACFLVAAAFVTCLAVAVDRWTEKRRQRAFREAGVVCLPLHKQPPSNVTPLDSWRPGSNVRSLPGRSLHGNGEAS